MTTQNPGIQEGSVKIELSYYKTTLDMNCILGGLQHVNKNITISSIESKIIIPKVNPDYLIYFEDYLQDPSMEARGVIHSLYMKTSTKFVIVTKFNNDMIRKYIKTLKSTFELSKLNDPYNFNSENYMEVLQILFNDNPPFSYRDNSNRIIGVEGNLIDEFCKHQKLNYEIVNRDYSHLTAIVPNAQFDFSLYRRINAGSEITTDVVHLNDIGASQCVLVPRNIPVYVPFSSPYSKVVNHLFFWSIAAVMAVWKIFKWLQRQNLSVVDSTLEALKVLLGLGIDDNHWMRWSLKEKILLVPFLLMVMILMGVYESHMVSTVIAEPQMRSVKSIEELIKSDTIIYEYYQELGRFDSNKVYQLMSYSYVTLATIPENFDQNFAYFVSCRFGEEFLNSAENFVSDRRLFDMIPDDYIDTFLSTYLINENFPLKKQFKFMVRALDEAGIINHWTKDIVQLHFLQHIKNEDQKPILLAAMIVPVCIVIIGLVLGLVVFGFEFLVHKPLMERRGQLHTQIIKISTKFIFITKFNSKIEYDKLVDNHRIRVVTFLHYVTYANALIVDVIGDTFEIQKLYKTIDASYIHLNFGNEFILGQEAYPEVVRTLFFENPPFSQLNVNQKITGVEGNLIDEFCMRHKYEYTIVGADFKRLMDVALDFKYDFSLYRSLTDANGASSEILNINDVGASQCILVPRNIPVYVMFSSPYSMIVNVLFLVSIAAVMLTWKIFKKIQKQKLGAVDSIIETLKVLIGLGLSNIHWLQSTLKEKLLLVPFLFMIMVLMEIYESYMVSNVISEHEMDSVKSVQELLYSDTKIFEYHNETGRFGTEKVVKLVKFVDTRLASIPKDFDPNFAYFVRCRFGEEFVSSDENYVGHRKLFDMIPDTERLQLFSTYLVNQNTPLKNDFKFMVKALDEAGIIDHWTKDIIRNTFQQYEAQEELQTISLSQLLVPLLIIAVGSMLSCAAYGLEVIFHKFRGRSNRVGDLQMEMKRVRNKVGIAKSHVKNRRRHSV
ncbi:unnamed protein product [Chironomus riparius]|uniref:Ionotropic receptor n=1 Tax=Chironomus riparius TaxID=315576 RepID=A0A9N9WVR5_9DIPT|nr:unnamed protein product [Chironomus riparius]